MRLLRGGTLRWFLPPLGILFYLLLPGLVQAHAVVVNSDPPGACAADETGSPTNPGGPCLGSSDQSIPLTAPPSAVRVWFSEPVEPYGVGLSVLGPSGQRVDRPPVRVAGPALGVDVDASVPGTYLVQWEVVARDTHPGRGSFTFSVGHPGGVVASLASGGASSELGEVDPVGLALQVAARWLHFLGYALSFGVIAFQVAVPSPRSPSPTRSGGPPLHLAPSQDEVDRRLGQLINVGILALLVAEPVAILGQTASLGVNQMLDPVTMSAAFDSSFGRALGERLGAPVLLWVILGVVRSGIPKAIWLALVVAGGLAVLDGSSAHAGSVKPAALGFALNAVHLAAVGVWTGGLAALIATWSLGGLAGTINRKWIVERFGKVAAVSFGIVALTGVGMAALHLIRLDDLIDTDYGKAIVAKSLVVGVAVVFAFAANRRFRLSPRRWLTVECVALAVVLGFAALVVSLPPPT